MKRKSNLSLDLFGDRLVTLRQDGEETDTEYRRMLQTLRNAIEGELTDRQRTCITLRYFDRKSVNEVAEILGLTAGTVSKHIKKGRERLQRVMRYSFTRLQ